MAGEFCGSKPVPDGRTSRTSWLLTRPTHNEGLTLRPMHKPVWAVEHFPVVDSTQSTARSRPAWSAVTADEQTAGRGQRERSFVSDPGGLYLTAVLPYEGDALASRGFALVVGWAVRETLRRVGVVGLRLRWPNDLMVGSRKVGGILVEQAGLKTLLVGIGLNLSNEPWRLDPSLEKIAGRLGDAGGGRPLPDRHRLVELLLGAIRAAHEIFSRRQLAGMVPVLNRCWGRTRRVRLEILSGNGLTEIEGDFLGIGPTGCLLLRTPAGMRMALPEHHINRLREVEPGAINPTPLA